MGAYFQATIEREHDKKRYCTHTCGNGLKLLEHGYIGNNYVDSIMNLLHIEKGKLTWLCDYHEEPGMQWSDIEEVDKVSEYCTPIDKKYIIVNHTKKIIINIEKLIKLHNKDGRTTLLIHPLPILCNSDNEAMGGGDYRKDDSTRSTWKGDLIEIIIPELNEKVPENYEDVTKDCIYTEY